MSKELKSDQQEPRYADVVHHANVNASLSYVARKTGLTYPEAERLLELALKRGDLNSNDYAGRRLVNHVDDHTKALQARIAELEAWQEDVRSNSPLLARLERAEQRVQELEAELTAERRHKPARDVAAVRTLAVLGYDWHGGEQWKPPIGKAPDFDLIDSLRTRITELEAQHGRKPLDTRTVVSDDELAKAFAVTNFGGADHRQELHVAVLKKACGYHCGHTITTIMRELGLIGASGLPTKKGRKLISLAFHQYMVGGP